MRSVIGDMVSGRNRLTNFSYIVSARDYVEGMWRMLQQTEAEDFVLATGETHPVREYVEKAFACVGVKLRYDKVHISLTSRLMRNADGKALGSTKKELTNSPERC